MANRRYGETGLSESGPSNHPPPYGIRGFQSPSSAAAAVASSAAPNFFDSEGSAYFGELEEALMQGVVGIRDRKPAAFLPPRTSDALPTLEIFPSWPLRFSHPSAATTTATTTQGNSQSADSTTDSGSAQNNPTVSPLSVRGGGGGSSSEYKQQPEQLNQLEMSTDPSRTGVGTVSLTGVVGVGVGGGSTQQHKPQEKIMRSRASSSSIDKILDPKTARRLAQNREAARKSRLRKKAYVQQLETSRIKLTQLEQDLQRTRSQGAFSGGAGPSGGNLNSGAAIFDMEYARWLEEDEKHMSELRVGLQAHLPDSDLRQIVDECLLHYDEIFRLKSIAANSDVFHLITGMWTTPAERCFLWIGGSRPSEMLNILMPQLDPLTEQQIVEICNLRTNSVNAENALSQGLNQLQQSLADTVAGGSLNDNGDVGNYMGQMAIALGKLSNLENFVRQADNLRQQTLHHMRRILTIRQAARCFMAIGEYHNRLRTVSSLWSSRPRENNMEGEDSMYQF